MIATTAMTITRPLTSTMVMTTLLVSDSLIPRALRHATNAKKTIAAGTAGTSTNVARYSPKNARDRPAALVTPAASMLNPTRNDTNGSRNARSANTAAPPARGYFVTISAYEPAVGNASNGASASGAHSAPPTSCASTPISA